MGSLLDLPSRDWFGDFNPDVMIHVIDSNRPQNLESLFSKQPEAQRIIVWDDGNVDNLRKQREAYETLLVSAYSVLNL
jgi:cell division control protein 45